MDDVLSDIEGTVPVSTDEGCLEKTGSLCAWGGCGWVVRWGGDLRARN